MSSNFFNSESLLMSMRRSAGFAPPHYFVIKRRSPYINRFLSADTIVPGYANPQALNRYSYVLNNPIKLIDPTGHKCVGEAEECLDDDGNPINGTGGLGGGNNNGNDLDSDLGQDIPMVLPCGGMLTCPPQSLYDYATSLLPFTSSNACYFLLHDPILCSSSSWQNFPNSIVAYANFPYLPPNSANWDLDPANADYTASNLNLFFVVLEITNDRYDQSFISVGGSTSAFGISYINGSIGDAFDNTIPSWQETRNFLTGPAVNVTGSFFFGVGGTGSPQVLIENGLNSDIKPYAVEGGIHVTYPSISVSGTWGWQLP